MRLRKGPGKICEGLKGFENNKKGLKVSVLSWSCLCLVSVMSQSLFRVAWVMSGSCLGDVSVMSRSCFGRVSGLCRSCLRLGLVLLV